MNDNKRLAWHFAPANGKLAHTGEPIPADGVTLRLSGEITACERGYHASERIIDALQYVNQDSIICRVELSGTIIEHGNPIDKLCASERTILWRLDFETTDRILREHARWSALQVAHLWNMPDVVREYLETGREDLRAAARAAARAATWDAAWAAARDAARAATWAAARAATWAAARDAAGDAAWAAAWAAARAATWDAARDAARAAQNERLTALIEEAYAASQEAGGK